MKKVLLILAALSVQSVAMASNCEEQFFNGIPPKPTRSGLPGKQTFICYAQYAIQYSGETRTPIWTAEFLTTNRIKEAARLKRTDSFHEETSVPASDRAYLSDYKGSSKLGYDRGHMAPNKDFSTYESQYEAFSLANIIPQSSDNNQNLWEGTESAVRDLTKRHERLYVITGPIFDEKNHKLNNRVTIPTRIFKAIYDPYTKSASAYVVGNHPGMEYDIVSIAELNQILGIDLFPALPDSVKAKKTPLPEPTPHSDAHKKRQAGYRFMGFSMFK